MRVEVRIEDPALGGLRVDRFLAENLGLFSRSQIPSRVRELAINGVPCRPSRRLKVGDLVRVDYENPLPSPLAPEPIPIAVIFENEDVVVLDKPQGMVVHPGSGNRSGTLVNALLAHHAGLGDAFGAGEGRPGIVHRLDKDTSGVMVVAKNPAAHEALAAQFKSREVRKRYLAVVGGGPPENEGRIEAALARSRRDRRLFAAVRVGGRLPRARRPAVRPPGPPVSRCDADAARLEAEDTAAGAGAAARVPRAAAGTFPRRAAGAQSLWPRSGLNRRSTPMVVGGPCPGNTRMASGSVRSVRRIPSSRSPRP